MATQAATVPTLVGGTDVSTTGQNDEQYFAETDLPPHPYQAIAAQPASQKEVLLREMRERAAEVRQALIARQAEGDADMAQLDATHRQIIADADTQIAQVDEILLRQTELKSQLITRISRADELRGKSANDLKSRLAKDKSLLQQQLDGYEAMLKVLEANAKAAR